MNHILYRYLPYNFPLFLIIFNFWNHTTYKDLQPHDPLMNLQNQNRKSQIIS